MIFPKASATCCANIKNKIAMAKETLITMRRRPISQGQGRYNAKYKYKGYSVIAQDVIVLSCIDTVKVILSYWLFWPFHPFFVVSSILFRLRIFSLSYISVSWQIQTSEHIILNHSCTYEKKKRKKHMTMIMIMTSIYHKHYLTSILLKIGLKYTQILYIQWTQKNI